MTRKKRAPRIVDAPMAVTSAGGLLVNLAHLVPPGDVLRALQKLVPRGCEVFVGVVVPERERASLAKDIEDAASELACRMGGRLVG